MRFGWLNVQWDGTVTLGAVLTMLTMVLTVAVAYHQAKLWLAVKIESFDKTLETHAKTLTEHAARMQLYEGRALTLVADLQRLIGRAEAEWNGKERRYSS